MYISVIYKFAAKGDNHKFAVKVAYITYHTYHGGSTYLTYLTILI